MPATSLLAGHPLLVVGRSPVLTAAENLLGWLGAEVHTASAGADRSSLDRLPVSGALAETGSAWQPPFPVVRVDAGADPAAEWARSGGMWLTGDETGPPVMVAGQHASRLRAAALVLELLTGVHGRRVVLDGPALVGERAACSGLRRAGTRSCSGSCRLLRAADGWLAVNLPRRADVDLVGAWIGAYPGCDTWSAVRRAVRGMGVADAAERAALLGLAVAPVAATREVTRDVQGQARGQVWPPAPFLVDGLVPRPLPARSPVWTVARPTPARSVHRPVVVELAGLWAGPLATSLLHRAGARVIKVEGPRRPDGTRSGPGDFFDLLNAGKESLVLDLGEPEGLAALRAVLDAADVVVEGMRPRVLENLGIDREHYVAAGRRTVWVCLTGYGIGGPYRNRPAYGDDAAVAGGAALAAGGPDQPRFLADAFADPVTGLMAAVAAVAGLVGGSGHLVDVAMREVVAYLLADTSADAVRPSGAPARHRVVPPVSRPVVGPGPVAGADNDRLAREFGFPPGRHGGRTR